MRSTSENPKTSIKQADKRSFEKFVRHDLITDTWRLAAKEKGPRNVSAQKPFSKCGN
jgi:hypothetical protein